MSSVGQVMRGVWDQIDSAGILFSERFCRYIDT